MGTIPQSAQAEIWLDIGEVADISQSEVTYDALGRMTSSQLLKQSDFRSLSINSRNGPRHNSEADHKVINQDQSESNQVCIARLEPLGQLGSDRIAVDFAIDERRVLIATIKDLLTDKLLINQQAIAKLE